MQAAASPVKQRISVCSWTRRRRRVNPQIFLLLQKMVINSWSWWSVVGSNEQRHKAKRVEWNWGGREGGKGRGKDCRGPAFAIFLIKVSNGQTDRRIAVLSCCFRLASSRVRVESSRAELSGALNEHLTVLMVLCCPLPLRILNCILMAFHFLCAFGRGTGTRCCCQVLILFALTRVKLE